MIVSATVIIFYLGDFGIEQGIKLDQWHTHQRINFKRVIIRQPVKLFGLTVYIFGDNAFVRLSRCILSIFSAT